jgi:signal transduction histidine kinase
MDKARHFIGKYRYFFLAFILLEILIYLVSYYRYTSNSEQYTLQKVKEFKIGLSAVTHHYELTSNSFYNEILAIANLRPMLRQAANADGVKKDEIRRIIYAGIQPIHNQMKATNLEYLSFFLPDNQALIRFEDPDFYGDKVGDTRLLIAEANLSKKQQAGFEIGLASAGYRFIYPIFDSIGYVGCVELGVGFTGIRKELKRILAYELRFLIEKDQLLKTTPFVKLDNFSFSDLSERFMYEKPSLSAFENDTTISTVKNTTIIQFNKDAKKEIESNLNTKKTFGQSRELADGDVYALFLSIEGSNKQIASFIIAYTHDSTIVAYKKDHYILFSIASILSLIVIILIGFNYTKNKIIKANRDQLLLSEKQLKEINASKDKFFSIIAHDLRNPFHGLVGLTQVLVEDGDSLEKERINKFHRLLYDSAKQGYQLVLNLLEWTRIQTGRLVISPERIHMARLVDDCVMLINNAAESKHIRIVTKVEPGLFAFADENMLSTVLRNLLSNAVKFSYPGNEVLVKASWVNNMAEVTITDYGLGMDKQTMDNLFKIEVSQSSAGTEGEQGTGLGLILCREFVEKNLGSLTFTSELGKGSVFCVRLPLS